MGSITNYLAWGSNDSLLILALDQRLRFFLKHKSNNLPLAQKQVWDRDLIRCYSTKSPDVNMMSILNIHFIPMFCLGFSSFMR